jgi:predicted nuclease of restriction endonuclease-like (RecB) superfamily
MTGTWLPVQFALATRTGQCSPYRHEKDDYPVLEFLDLKDEYSESNPEDALIHRLEELLLELGRDFTFVGRQGRLRIGDRWFPRDLLFFPTASAMSCDHRPETQ